MIEHENKKIGTLGCRYPNLKGLFMKSLSDYTSANQTQLFADNGAFFAFGQSQFEEQRVEGEKYVQLTSGLLCPYENAATVVDGLKRINDEGVARDIKENGLDAIIERELANYECTYTYDTSDAVSALEDYKIEPEHINKIFRKMLTKEES